MAGKKVKRKPAQKAERKSHANGFSELCRRLGKSPAYVRNVQSILGLHFPTDGDGYTEAYAAFLETVIALRTFSVPFDEIAELFEVEKKILRLLKIDSLTTSPTWYLDACSKAVAGGKRLLLTNHDLGASITADGVQFHLDFRGSLPELFSGPEMGEDVCRVVDTYLERLARIRGRVKTEEPLLLRSLAWSARAWE
jgi:hypothetical protein